MPLDYINKDGQVDSTYAYMYETSYLENQTETISQKANIIYDENGRIAKTEVIAQQDKNLEIKLKSIDTQHSAISTEIEALNKVLQNNVKSGFNTFNA